MASNLTYSRVIEIILIFKDNRKYPFKYKGFKIN